MREGNTVIESTREYIVKIFAILATNTSEKSRYIEVIGIQVRARVESKEIKRYLAIYGRFIVQAHDLSPLGNGVTVWQIPPMNLATKSPCACARGMCEESRFPSNKITGITNF